MSKKKTSKPEANRPSILPKVLHDVGRGEIDPGVEFVKYPAHVPRKRRHG